MHFTHLTTTIGNDDFETNYDGTLFRLKASLGLGYNSKTFYAGIDGKIFRTFKAQEEVQVEHKETGKSFRIFFGFHILAPRKINSAYDKFEDKFYQ